jgi:hypothetical protein
MGLWEVKQNRELAHWQRRHGKEEENEMERKGGEGIYRK